MRKNISFLIQNLQVAVIIGAGHGIGFALVEELTSKNSNLLIYATYRNSENAQSLTDFASKHSQVNIHQLDPTNELAIKSFFESFSDKKIDLIINSVGLLHNQELSPEKSLRDINSEQLIQYFKVNSIVTPLIAKYLTDNVSKDKEFCFATISAKVGSISDNRMGGWYGYRASKAALNMFIKTIAIEFSRKYKKSIVLAIHPGTTKTDLSGPFIKNTPYKLHTPKETAKNILSVIENKKSDDTGKFYAWDGEELAW